MVLIERIFIKLAFYPPGHSKAMSWLKQCGKATFEHDRQSALRKKFFSGLSNSGTVQARKPSPSRPKQLPCGL
jgi:hypothetical protein